MVEFNGAVYSYVHNLQGDIVGIVDSAGSLVVEYKYNAWGKPLSTTGTLADTLGKRNPFRYRGYGYDEETGLYYLQNRYYMPKFGKFCNADSVTNLCVESDINCCNLYSYCINSPTNRFDVEGNWSLPNWAKVVVGAVATVAAVAVTVVTGGTALPVIASVAASTVVGGAIGYATGGVEGMKEGLANGFMAGGLMSLGGSMLSASIRAVRTARQGITIGRNMVKVNSAAGLTNTATYSNGALWGPLRTSYYSAIKYVFGAEAANKLSLICNEIYIRTMKALGAVIYDSGLNGEREAGIFYAMEKAVLEGYERLINMVG